MSTAAIETKSNSFLLLNRFQFPGQTCPHCQKEVAVLHVQLFCWPVVPSCMVFDLPTGEIARLKQK